MVGKTTTVGKAFDSIPLLEFTLALNKEIAALAMTDERVPVSLQL
jgi:hypothetical protein